MKLIDGNPGRIYSVCAMDLPIKTAKRLEALGMIRGTKISPLYFKASALIVSIRGTRFALGKTIAQNITIEEITL